MDTYISEQDQLYLDVQRGKWFECLIGLGSISSATYIGITTPAATSKTIMFLPITLTTSAENVAMIIYEALAYTSGSAYTALNMNRNSAVASTLTLKSGVTATPGSEIVIDRDTFTVYGNTNRKLVSVPIVLKAATNYVIGLTPAGVTTVNLFGLWKEV